MERVHGIARCIVCSKMNRQELDHVGKATWLVECYRDRQTDKC